jgi:hypothetical protein
MNLTRKHNISSVYNNSGAFNPCDVVFGLQKMNLTNFCSSLGFAFADFRKMILLLLHFLAQETIGRLFTLL